SVRDPRLYALSIGAEQLAHSSQPLVPERVFMASADGKEGGSIGGMLGMLMNLLVAEKSGFQLTDHAEPAGLKEFSERMVREAMESVQQPIPVAANRSEEHTSELQ